VGCYFADGYIDSIGVVLFIQVQPKVIFVYDNDMVKSLPPTAVGRLSSTRITGYQ
jgi:hypothetical protein